MITQVINLNLIPGQVLPRVNVSQYDSGTRTLQMTLFNGEQIFNVPSGASGFIQGTKPDRTGFQYAATVTAGSNIVTIDITQQMTAVKGEVVCELVLANDDDRIATVNFILYVEAAALSEDTVISETDLPLIEEAAELAERIDGIVQQVDEDAQTASNAADKAEAYGTHPPYIGANGNWFVYNVTTQQYEDSGVEAQGPLSGLTDVEISNLAENDIIAYDATAQKWKNSSEVKDMNNVYGAKNLLPYPYYENRSSLNGITYVINSDGSVTFNGTATANAYFNCTYTDKIVDFGDVNFNSKSNSSALYKAILKNGSNNIYLNYNASNKVTAITITSGTVCENLTVYPMICLASIIDDTYEPYAKTNQQLTDDVKNTGAIEPMLNVLGAKNLLPNNKVTQVSNGITFTVNDDGSVRLTGTATNVVYFDLPVDLTDGVTYTASGISGGSGTTYQIHLQTADGSSTNAGSFVNGERTFTKNSGQASPNNYDVHKYRIRVASGVTVDTVIYPMIRLASISDDTYVPYAKTNKELTENEVKYKEVTLTYESPVTLSPNTSGRFYITDSTLYNSKLVGVEITGSNLGSDIVAINAIGLTKDPTIARICVPIYNNSSADRSVSSVTLRVYYI